MLQKATRHVAMAVKAGRGQSKAAKSWHSREQAGSKLVVPVSWQGLDQSCAIFRSSCFSRKKSGVRVGVAELSLYEGLGYGVTFWF